MPVCEDEPEEWCGLGVDSGRGWLLSFVGGLKSEA